MKNLVFDFSGGKHEPLVLDIETQYLSHEVDGGWNAVEKFKVAVAVTWDGSNGFRFWYEADVPRLFQEAMKFHPIVTFNGEGFDFKVLSAYGAVNPFYQSSTDLLLVLRRKLGFRIKLESLAQATLKRAKSASGTDSVAWWRSGDPALRQKVCDYCRQDVELTRDIYMFGKERGYVLVDDALSGSAMRVEVAW